VAVEKEQGRERLVLRRRRNTISVGEMVEERGDLGGTHIRGMTPAVKADEPEYPVHIRLLRLQAVVARPQGLAHPWNKPRP